MSADMGKWSQAAYSNRSVKRCSAESAEGVSFINLFGERLLAALSHATTILPADGLEAFTEQLVRQNLGELNVNFIAQDLDKCRGMLGRWGDDWQVGYDRNLSPGERLEFYLHFIGHVAAGHLDASGLEILYEFRHLNGLPQEIVSEELEANLWAVYLVPLWLAKSNATPSMIALFDNAVSRLRNELGQESVLPAPARYAPARRGWLPTRRSLKPRWGLVARCASIAAAAALLCQLFLPAARDRLVPTSVKTTPAPVSRSKMLVQSIDTAFPLTHSVQRGETLGEIADREGVTLEALKVANNLTDPNELVVAETLKIPRPSAIAQRELCPGSATKCMYTVQPGDTAQGISTWLGVPLDELAKANDVSVTSLADLRAGQELALP